ncbi:hypothetical protein [Lactococcus protaetiae]|uniref:Uncharacterized protein n=1 Tax=Lactococcus protaetiae TaxID=2592653 RepID=A0A514ZA70_9LACT|nr:hypothetical protein [Lactococcus protaetiae]QDK71480.1 hypothetical protein FLP15_10290 [Lactococcus protaetiae]
MSELEKAKQIAAEALNFKSKAYYTIEQQNEIIEVNRKAFMKILSLSSLTIPKSIAEELDYVVKESFVNDYIRPYSDVGATVQVIEDGLIEDEPLTAFMFNNLSDEFENCNRRNIVYAYLNPLTRDFVEVEG